MLIRASMLMWRCVFLVGGSMPAVWGGGIAEERLAYPRAPWCCCCRMVFVSAAFLRHHGTSHDVAPGGVCYHRGLETGRVDGARASDGLSDACSDGMRRWANGGGRIRRRTCWMTSRG